MVDPRRKYVFFYPFLSVFFEDHNNAYLLRKVKQFSKCSFGEICSQCLITSPYIWN